MEYLPGYDAWKTAEPDFALDEQEEECCITLRVNLNTVLDVNGDLDAQAGQVAKLVLEGLQGAGPNALTDKEMPLSGPGENCPPKIAKLPRKTIDILGQRCYHGIRQHKNGGHDGHDQG